MALAIPHPRQGVNLAHHLGLKTDSYKVRLVPYRFSSPLKGHSPLEQRAQDYQGTQHVGMLNQYVLICETLFKSWAQKFSARRIINWGASWIFEWSLIAGCSELSSGQGRKVLSSCNPLIHQDYSVVVQWISKQHPPCFNTRRVLLSTRY